MTYALGMMVLLVVKEAIRMSQPIQLDGVSIPVQQQASTYVAYATWAVLLVVSLASAWTVLLYGSSKNRTDTAAALLVFGVLGVVNAVALFAFGEDRSHVDYCAGLVGVPAFPGQLYGCGPAELATPRINAEELQRITTLSSLGQIVPILSIFKDILQSWFSPPGLDESVKPRRDERKRARKMRRLASERSRVAWAPAWIACLLAAGLWILSLVT